MTEQRADVYTRITDQIVAAIEAGAGKCRMPWHHDGQATSRPINLASNKPYRGINVLVLWAAADRCGYANGLWGTYRQWLAVGAQVRKGERGTVVVLWKQTGNDNADNQGADGDDQNTRVFARAFTVFNVAQGVVGNIEGARTSMNELVTASQSATGALQAAQAGNQLLALQSQQLSDLTAMMASIGRAQSLDAAQKAAAQAQGREQLRRFLTPGTGYQPGSASMFHN